MSVSDLPVSPVIPVSDLSRSRHFYEGQLGFVGQPAPGGWALRCGGDSYAFLLESTDYPGKAAWPLASFRTDDLDASVADLIERGITLEQIHDGATETDGRGIAELEGMRIAWVRDPDHQVLSFFELTDDTGR
jgi:hypothetical protein